MVTIAHGGDTEQADLAGRSVQEIREAYQHVFSIPDDAIVMVNGKEVSDTYKVEDGQKVVFDKGADKFIELCA